jgi:xylulokinase
MSAVGDTSKDRILVAGVDSSTQSVKIVVRDAHSGELVREARASHPEGTEVSPRAWWDALSSLLPQTLDGVSALSVAGQQHGMVALDSSQEVVRDALLWNDTRSAQAADDLVQELGGPSAWAAAVGSVPVAAFTVSKLKWMAEHEPENANRTQSVVLPHDYLTAILTGNLGEPTTDRGDASGTGYWSPLTGEYRQDLVELALGHEVALPRVAGPSEIVGTAVGIGREDIAIGPGTGDNMGAALALGVKPGDVVVSLGTSGTAFAGSSTPTQDPSGFVAGFADATGNFLPLVCTLNAARILTATAAMLNVDFDEFARLALVAAPGAGGLTFIPYLDGERTPNLPDAQGSLHGMTRANMTPENISRSAIEGMFGGLADAVDALTRAGAPVNRVILIGGAAANPAVGQVASTMFNAPVEVPPAGEYVADGAARQAAWVLNGELPDWSGSGVGVVRQFAPNYHEVIRANFRSAWHRMYA